MSAYMTLNGYINNSIQKGGVEGLSGCLENTGVHSQLILEVKEKKGSPNSFLSWLCKYIWVYSL